MKPIKYYAKELLELMCKELTLHPKLDDDGNEVVDDNGNVVMVGVSKTVTPGSRMLASQKQLNDFAVVEIPYGFRNKNVMQTALVRIELVVRNKQNGVQNVEKLQSMLDACTELFPIKKGRFFIANPNLALRGDDGAGFTIWCIHVNVEVNTLDRYDD